jgi:hypothetical protein
MAKIALLIPTTTRNQIIPTIHDLPFLKWLLPTLLSSLTSAEKEAHEITFFLGIDDNDTFYLNDVTLAQFQAEFNHVTANSKLKLVLIKCDSTNNNPVKVWNTLHYIAYNDGYEYFYQLGDDIQFLTGEWLSVFINTLNSNGIGIVGAFDINPTRPLNLITQSFTNRKHMEIFGCYYPPSFTNWHSDNWIQNVYGEKSVLLDFIRIKNAGGVPRYAINNKADILDAEVLTGKEKINEYLNANASKC